MDENKMENEAHAEEFDVEAWLEEGRRGMRRTLKHKRGARPSSLLPGEFKGHVRAARREMLLAVRSLLDAAIERLEERPPAAEAETEAEAK